jgi:succinate dehydrogenase / fumarate reductase cytochrome b subunit
MKLLVRPVQSSLGSKYVMALTGLALIGFVLGHMAGNLLIYAGQGALNSYAHALKSRPALLWTARLGLLAVFLVHVILGSRLTLQNTAARGPVRYFCERTVQASWASRHMMLTGLVLLGFIVYHLAHFTLGVVQVNVSEDVYGMVVAGFSNPWVTLSYLVAMAFLGLHLWHGGSSWFQSLGLNGRREAKVISWVGPALAGVVVAGNCSIPLAVLVGLVR